MKSLAGQVLIASPHLPDSNFSATVVLILEHNDEGAFGLVLNRPTGTTVGELWKIVSEEDTCQSIDPVSSGGPVSGPLICLHGHPEHSESEVIPGVHVCAQRENVDAIIKKDESPYRVFLGYSGWGGGQLESEMEVGGWLLGPATYDLVFADDVYEVWRNVIQNAGKDVMRDALNINEFPDDPSVN